MTRARAKIFRRLRERHSYVNVDANAPHAETTTATRRYICSNVGIRRYGSTVVGKTSDVPNFFRRWSCNAYEFLDVFEKKVARVAIPMSQRRAMKNTGTYPRIVDGNTELARKAQCRSSTNIEIRSSISSFVPWFCATNSFPRCTFSVSFISFLVRSSSRAYSTDRSRKKTVKKARGSNRSSRRKSDEK